MIGLTIMLTVIGLGVLRCLYLLEELRPLIKHLFVEEFADDEEPPTVEEPR